MSACLPGWTVARTPPHARKNSKTPPLSSLPAPVTPHRHGYHPKLFSIPQQNPATPASASSPTTTACPFAGDMGSAPATAAAAAAFPTSPDVAIAGALLFLADSSTAPPLLTLSDELSSYSASSSSYSATSARSCVSDSARLIDPLRALAVVASLRRIDPKVLEKATSKLFQGEAPRKRKGVWIQISDDEDERASTVASEGSAITAATSAASAGSTATSGRCRRPPRASGAGGYLTERADAIMEWLSRPMAVPATEAAIRAAVCDNAKTSKAMRWLLKQERLRRAGTGGRFDPYVYMVAG
ncbi:uncharacterized protein [Lolium perenne]|uniref:uncharacterized protein n=1 Tax=Lolium perenne TaxID=4522 RepID=UPI0021F5AB0E|nr:uncharacterized protein LOC127331823 [Lolium perenne]